MQSPKMINVFYHILFRDSQEFSQTIWIYMLILFMFQTMLVTETLSAYPLKIREIKQIHLKLWREISLGYMLLSKFMYICGVPD